MTSQVCTVRMTDNILENSGTALTTVCHNITVTGNKITLVTFNGYQTVDSTVFAFALSRIVNFHNNKITNVRSPLTIFINIQVEHRVEFYFTGNYIRTGSLQDFIKIVHSDDTSIDYVYMRNNTVNQVTAQSWMDFSRASFDIQHNYFIDCISFKAESSLFLVPETNEHGVVILNNNIFDSPGLKYIVEMVSNRYTIGMLLFFH